MLPIYLLGNFHCMGMCGPLVALIGRHRFNYHYLLGRFCSFSLAGGLAGGTGAVLGAFLQQYQLAALTSFLFGTFVLLLAWSQLTGRLPPGGRWISVRMAGASRALTPLILQDRRFPTFLFGFFTIALPCGQTLLVYSACALSGDATIGLLNGALFALLTSPSLVLAMHAHQLLPKLRGQADRLIGVISLFVGLLAICRGLAEVGWIPHFILSAQYHLVLF